MRVIFSRPIKSLHVASEFFDLKSMLYLPLVPNMNFIEGFNVVKQWALFDWKNFILWRH